MSRAVEANQHAARARDAAVVRLRRVTRISVALMVAAGGAFTVLAAGSTHVRKTAVAHVVSRRVASTATLVRAPAPPLVGIQSAPVAPATAPAPPPAAAATYQQPVVVSGGS